MKTNRVMRAVAAALAVASVSLAPIEEAHAQWIVADPGNLVENVLQAMQSLQSNINEATSIANQMTQLAHEIQNLQQLPSSVANNLLTQYTGHYNQLVSNFNTINGLAKDITNLSTNYANLFPDRASSGPVTVAGINSQLQSWLNQSRKTYQGIYQQSGQVMAALPNASSQVSAILNQAQASQGNLDAAQAQTQMQGQVATQLINLNSQMATMFQAQGDMMAQQAQLQDVAARRRVDSRVDFTTPSSTPPAAYLPMLH